MDVIKSYIKKVRIITDRKIEYISINQKKYIRSTHE